MARRLFRSGSVRSGSSPSSGLSSSGDVEAFLAAADRTPLPSKRSQGGKGRLLFALDATFSRAPTWDRACALQAEMFREAAGLGGVSVKLVFFRGFNECKASPWVDDGAVLARLMAKVRCRGGRTQIGRTLDHGLRETLADRVAAMVYVGDAVEESIDDLADKAGRLGVHGLPLFMFQEGDACGVGAAFRELARLSGGAYARFDAGAGDRLAALLRSVWRYAAGGRRALADLGAAAPEALRLLEQLRR